MVEKKRSGRPGNSGSFESAMREIQRRIDKEEALVFSGKVLSECSAPSNVGRMADADGVGILSGTCGDTVEVYVRLSASEIDQATFFTDGCGPTVACGSMLTKMAKGMPIQDALQMSEIELLDALGGLPDEHYHCAKLAVLALKKAVVDALENTGSHPRVLRFRCRGCGAVMALSQAPAKCAGCGSRDIVREGWKRRHEKKVRK